MLHFHPPAYLLTDLLIYLHHMIAHIIHGLMGTASLASRRGGAASSFFSFKMRLVRLMPNMPKGSGGFYAGWAGVWLFVFVVVE